MRWFVSSLLGGVLVGSVALAQSRPIEPRPPATPPIPAAAPATSMLATERFLFVVRGDVLYQFDVLTLALLNTHAFPAAKGDRTRPVAPPISSKPDATWIEPAWPVSPVVATNPFGEGIDAALQWLEQHQDEDGHWDSDGFMKHDLEGDPCDGPGNAIYDVGLTGLSMLAMLGGGSTLRGGAYQDNLQRAAVWLCDQQSENGMFGSAASQAYIYDHAIATFAMCEAYGLSSKHARLKDAAQKGLHYLESHRNPYGVWRYQPRGGDGDTSATTWAVLACASGKAFGLAVDEATTKTALVYYDAVTGSDGRVGYTKAGERSSRPVGRQERFPAENGEAMTAAGLFGRFVLGQNPALTPKMFAGADRLAACLPTWEPGHVDAVYWYFGSYAMYQMGGRHWQAWQPTLETLLVHQRQDGNFAGSWDPVGVWDEEGGRVCITALYALSLEAGYRIGKVK